MTSLKKETKARVIITMKCLRDCDGCCNKDPMYIPMIKNVKIEDLVDYDEVILTGGEPFLDLDKIEYILDYHLNVGFKGKIYLYSAYYKKEMEQRINNILFRVNGFQFTLHNEANDIDISDFRDLCELVSIVNRHHYKSFRLAIDKRLYDKWDFSNIDFSGWSCIRKLEWKLHCPLPDKEVLLRLVD